MRSKSIKNKYNLTLEQNVFLAKRNLLDNVYSNAKIEGKVDLDFICKINEIVAKNESLEWGKLRTRKGANHRSRIYTGNS
mgnify:CR=1 FL=1